MATYFYPALYFTFVIFFAFIFFSLLPFLINIEKWWFCVFVYLSINPKSVHLSINPKKSCSEAGQIDSPSVVFWKLHFLGRGWSPGFLWHLILLQDTFFLKILLKFLKTFERYDFFSLILTIFIDCLDFVTIYCCKETNDIILPSANYK